MSAITVKAHLDVKRPLKDGFFPIVLRITHNRDYRPYSTGKKASLEDWQKIESGKKLSPELRDLKNYLGDFVSKANDTVKELKYFSFETFKDAMFGNKSKDQKEQYTDVYSCYEMTIKELEKEGKIKTALSRRTAMKSLKAFSPKLTFEQCTPEFLKSYHEYMISQKKSLTTISIYTRTLKSIINLAISDNFIKADLYPYGRRKYQAPKARNPKKALTISEIENIFNYVPTNESQQWAKDMFIFSYLVGGINIKDISLLQFRNIDFETKNIYFVRAKTAKNNDFENIRTPLTNEAKEIMDRYILKQYPKRDFQQNDYVFPILTKLDQFQKKEINKDKSSAQIQVQIIDQTVQNINKWLRVISKEIGIEKDITTYTARHSFATILKRSGVSIEFISESLGHKNIKTTYSYLDSFDSDHQKEQLKALTNFKTHSNNEKES